MIFNSSYNGKKEANSFANMDIAVGAVQIISALVILGSVFVALKNK